MFYNSLLRLPKVFFSFLKQIVNATYLTSRYWISTLNFVTMLHAFQNNQECIKLLNKICRRWLRVKRLIVRGFGFVDQWIKLLSVMLYWLCSREKRSLSLKFLFIEDLRKIFTYAKTQATNPIQLKCQHT